ncbi:NAD(P)H-quinone oxidoreductase [Aeromicrobium sp.]|uniref:NAD(P)H-quinone oxidoreductase n=1 Tax=Aeromicrobium sp. TaxID=1871063 RepID=UPI003D6B70C3
MRAIVVNEPGGVDALEVVDRPDPEPGPGDVLIRVVAAGVNRADLMQRQGFYPPPPGASDILGLECSGEIAAVGAEVTGFAVGDTVCALLTAGGYAELVSVPAGQVAPVPEGLDLVDAAGVMETACTVWSNVVMVGRLQPGETLLVHGGGSGIGTTAIQIATAIGARVVTTVGSEEKAAVCRELGADVVVNYREQDFVDVLRDDPPNVILDIIGAKYLASNVSVLAPGGRLVVIGLQGGTKAELNIAALQRKRGSVTATTLRSRPADEKADIVAPTVENVWPMIAAGKVRPIVHSRFPLADVAQAHQVLEESSHVGKVLLTM